MSKKTNSSIAIHPSKMLETLRIEAETRQVSRRSAVCCALLPSRGRHRRPTVWKSMLLKTDKVVIIIFVCDNQFNSFKMIKSMKRLLFPQAGPDGRTSAVPIVNRYFIFLVDLRRIDVSKIESTCKSQTQSYNKFA